MASKIKHVIVIHMYKCMTNATHDVANDIGLDGSNGDGEDGKREQTDSTDLDQHNT